MKFFKLFLIVCCVFFQTAQAGRGVPVLSIESELPVRISVYEDGKHYPLVLPADFMDEVIELYDEMYLVDLTGDGVGEVVFRLETNGVNVCSRVLRYIEGNRSLVELSFNGGYLCNFKISNGYLVSAYRDGAIWNEEFYSVGGTKAILNISDGCVGCGEIKRKIYQPDGSFVRSLVADAVDFEKRIPLTAKVSSPRAKIFKSPEVSQSTKQYLVQGDEVMFLDFESVGHGDGWVEFRFVGVVTTEGWLRCSDVSGCSRF